MAARGFISTSAAAILAVAGATGVVPTAHAQWYFSGHVGTTTLSDSDTTVTGTGPNGTSEVEFDNGFSLAGAIGYSWRALRLEGEISYRANDLNKVSNLTGGGQVFPTAGSLTGDTSRLGFMANGWYDFDTGTKWVPYIGIGVGGANINLNVESVAGTAIGYDESTTVFAYQAGAGIGYKVTPKITVGISYRLFGTSEPEFDNGANKVEAEYLSHDFLAGILIKF